MLGIVNIPEVLTGANIILIQPRNKSPGLIVKNRDAFQVAHSGAAFNSIYIDQKIYDSLYSFETVALLTHEAIELGAKRLAQQRGIPWTVELSQEIHRIAEDYEIQIIGKGIKGSRLDDHIEELLGFAQSYPIKENEGQPVVTLDDHHSLTATFYLEQSL